MSGIDPIVVLIGLGAGGIAAILLRALFREMGTRPVGRQAVRTVQASGSLAHEQSDTTGSSPPPQNFPPHVTPGLPVPGADERRINTEQSDPVATLTQTPLNGSGRDGDKTTQEVSISALRSTLAYGRTAQFISFINFKGGVGKSTLAVETAAALARYFGKRVLLVDLDPQTNATFYLMDHTKWQSWQEANGSLKTLFEAYLLGHGASFDVPQVIKRDLLSQGGISLVPGLELLPSHLALIQVDVQLAAQTTAGAGVLSNLAIIRQALQQVQAQYDYVIFDCPPNFNLVTQNGLFASDAYVIPAIPDYLSTLGIDLIRGEVERFSHQIRQALTPSGGTFTGPELKGIVFTRVRVRSRSPLRFIDLHERCIQEVYRTNPELAFKNFISEAVRFAEAPERRLPVCLSARPEDRDARNEVLRLTEEFIERLGGAASGEGAGSRESSTDLAPSDGASVI
ncbi:MAG TPA: ParA family protein [Candidatus Binatia bacterium]|nr:ParA family protein [Candidatus Binatia bacterium]